jgi:cytochrome c556
MRRFAALAVFGFLSLSLLTGVLVAQRAGGARQKPPPTSFDQRVEDAFFADVLKAHGSGTLASLGAGGSVGGNSGSTPASPLGGDVEAGWAKIISAETLESEIKAAINEAGPHVETKTKWNTGHRRVRTLYSTMALCFSVISRYDGDVRFKKEALTLRDSLSRCAANAKVNSEQAMQEAKSRLNDLLQLRNGNLPVNAEADPKAAYKDFTDLAEIMKRISAAHERDGGSLKVWTASAADFKNKRSEILHEAEMLGMLAKIVQDPSYSSDYGAEFVQIAQEVQAATAAIAQAAKGNNLQAAQAAVGKISNACTNCHGKFNN